MTELDLSAIEARAKAATRGPHSSDGQNILGCDGLTILGYANHEDDARLWSHARVDVPALVAEVRRLRADLERERVRLAGCGVAALGYATDGNDCKPGEYGHSASFDDVKRLYDTKESYRKALDIALPALLKFAWEGSSVNYPARQALDDIRKLGLEQLLHECRSAIDLSQPLPEDLRSACRSRQPVRALRRGVSQGT